MKKLVIFDLDGTLLNTIDDLASAVNHALERNGFAPHPRESYNMMVGNGVRRLIERALPVDNRSEETVDHLLADFLQYYDEHLADATAPYPGVEDMLRALAASGIALAVASNKYESAVKRLIDRYFPYVDWVAVCGKVDGYPSKPDPSIVFRILAEHPTPKAAVLYVGDSAVDIETARRACVENVGVTWGFRPLRELTGAYADHIATTPAEVVDTALNPMMQ